MFNLHSYYRSFMPTFKVYLFVALFMIIGSAAMAEPYKILAFGDSLTAGYGMSPQDAYPAQLETKLKAAGYDVKIQNAGVSGDTTTGGLNRLDWSLQNKPDLVLLGLGANDALRNLNPDIPEKNLDQMLSTLQDREIDVLLLGMYAPRNFGPRYTSFFDSIYPDLADKYDVPLYPFLLDGVFGNPTLNLTDGLHPNQKGAEVMADKLLPFVREFLESEDN